MSSFICNDVTTEAAAAAIEASFNGTSKSSPTRSAIASALRDANAFMTFGVWGETFDYQPPRLTNRDFTAPEMIGSARCLLYQCDYVKGDNPDNMPKSVEALLNALDDAQSKIESHEIEIGEWKIEPCCGNMVTYAKTTHYRCISKTYVTIYDAPVEYPWGLDPEPDSEN